MSRVVGPLVGVALLALVAWLGFRSADDSSYIVWFGLASAIVAPVGLVFVGLPFRRRSDRILRDLSSVAEIQDLIAQADSEQERLQLLEDERQRLAEIVRVEARRQTLEEQRSALLDSATRVLGALEALDQEASSLRLDMERSAILPEVRALAERLEARQQGKVILRFGERYIAVDPGMFNELPFVFGGRALGVVFPSAVRWLGAWQRRRDGAS